MHGCPSEDEFFPKRMSPANMDTCGLRTAIRGALRQELPRFSGILLDLGCGFMPYKRLVCTPPSRVTDYVGMDLGANEHYRIQPDLVWDGSTIPLADSSVGCALATEVLEHCPDPGHVLGEISRVLEPGGVLFFSVPFVWPLHNVPHDECRYTPYALERHFAGKEFTNLRIKALGGWDAVLAQVLALWVRRRPMGRRRRHLLSVLLLPFVRVLSRHDKPPPRFSDGWLFTGLAGTATKRDAEP